MEDYDPIDIELQRVKSRLSSESWRQRVQRAKADEEIIKSVLEAAAKHGSQNDAIANILPKSRRSWALRRLPLYREKGFEALIDARTPREPKVSRAIRDIVQETRRLNPKLSVEEALRSLQKNGVPQLPSASTIKREFARADARRRYAEKPKGQHTESEPTKVIELPLAGGELLEAAEVETGGIAALTQEVVQLANEAKIAANGAEPSKDVARRDKLGRFTDSYNRSRRRKQHEEIAGYLRPAEEKAEGRVPTWPRFVHERSDTIDAKLRTITYSWLVSKTKGWAALRSPDAAGLEALSGFAYMPSTLSKMVSALAISGAGDRLLEAMASHWHQVAQRHYGAPGAMAAIYIDNHAKEVWSSLYMMSGKVSHRNRVMPCITTTYAHTGAGTPLVLSVQSGSAPLAPRLVKLVEQAEKVFESEVSRALIIDSEGSTFDVLDSFKKAKRIIVTPLRPSRAPELILEYDPGSYYRPYRDNDELRIARCTLKHKTTGRSLELGALLVRREHRESDTVLLTNGLEHGVEGRALADLYYRRWPIQENAFKEGAALGLDKHRGNCARMVANVAVVTELEKIDTRLEQGRRRLTDLAEARGGLEAAAKRSTQEENNAQKVLAKWRRRLDDLVASAKTLGKAFNRAAVKHQQALGDAEAKGATASKARAAHDENLAKTKKIEQQQAELTERQKHLEPQRRIRQLDVAQDKILTATKLTAAQLITFVLREYMPTLPSTPQTFSARIFPLRGRKEINDQTETIIFYENPRDPQVTQAIKDACVRLNQRNLNKGGRRLQYAVETPPIAPVRLI